MRYLIKNFTSKNHILILFLLVINTISYRGIAESNSSTVTNSAAPSASSVTSGGTSVNYQTNNTFNNDLGFGPGYSCRTPSLYFGTNVAQQDTHNFTSLGGSSAADNTNYGANIGIALPFGSPAIDSCLSMAKQTAVDKQISSQLSMIRACANLKREGIAVDSVKYPLLASCEIKPGEPDILLSKKAKKRDLPKKSKDTKPLTLKIPRLIED